MRVTTKSDIANESERRKTTHNMAAMTDTGYLVQQRNGEQPGSSGLQINVSETGLQRLIGLLEGRMDASQSDNATVIDVESE